MNSISGPLAVYIEILSIFIFHVNSQSTATALPMEGHWAGLLLESVSALASWGHQTVTRGTLQAPKDMHLQIL